LDVDVANKLIEQYALNDGKYNRPLARVALDEDECDAVLNSVIFPELTIDISGIFDF
jgi:hypothetical protein